MQEEMLRSFIAEKLIDFQSQRLSLLRTVSFAAAYKELNPILLWLSVDQSASACVEEAILTHLGPEEEALFVNAVIAPVAELLERSTPSVSAKETNSQNGQSSGQITYTQTLYFELIKRIQPHLMSKLNNEYQNELAHTMNRQLRSFIPTFCNPDGSINWEKLVAFNSGIE
ncbi:MAG: hypothetical protein ACT4QE_23065 [Anaerolineales bacterium]